MRVAAVIRDLMIYSRIEVAVRRAGARLVRVDHPASVPPDADLVIVDWTERDESWTAPLRAIGHRGSRVVLFGPHVDLEAHAAAKAAGIGPMWARSRLLTGIESLLASPAGEAPSGAPAQ